MNTVTTAENLNVANAAVADAALDDLLVELGDGAVLETIETANAAATGADEVIEALEPSVDAIDASAAALTDSLLDEIGDAVIETEQIAAQPAAVEVVEPTEAPKGKKAGGKKGGKKNAKKDEPASEPAAVEAGAEAASADPLDGLIADAVAGVEGQEIATDGAAAAAPEAAKPPKAPRATTITHNRGDLLVHKLGTSDAAALLVFDDRHDGEQIQAAHADFIARMNDNSSNGIADKVRDKINMFLCWLAKGGELNEVLKRTITVLHTDGKLTSGDKGNLITNLLAKPYSPGTARSQANQMFMALPELQMVIKSKGEMVPNPHSPLLQMAYAALGLAK